MMVRFPRFKVITPLFSARRRFKNFLQVLNSKIYLFCIFLLFIISSISGFGQSLLVIRRTGDRGDRFINLVSWSWDRSITWHFTFISIHSTPWFLQPGARISRGLGRINRFRWMLQVVNRDRFKIKTGYGEGFGGGFLELIKHGCRKDGDTAWKAVCFSAVVHH